MSTILASIFRVFEISPELDLQLFKIPRQTYKYLRSQGKPENLKSTWIKHAGMPSKTKKIHNITANVSLLKSDTRPDDPLTFEN